MAQGAFQGNAFQPDTFAIGYTATFTVLESVDTVSNAFIVGVTTKVTFTLFESQDQAAFIGAARTIAGFNVLEAVDAPSFNVDLEPGYFVEFYPTEAIDTATFGTHARHVVEFSLGEAADVFAATAVSTTIAGFNVTEISDGAYFRSIAAFFDVGDADFIYVPPQADVISIPPVTDATVAAERQTSSVPDEWQRIDVDETRTWRKD